MKKLALSIGGIVLLLLVLFLGNFALQTPEVLGSNVNSVEKTIAQNAPIIINFNTMMDQRSVEERFSITPKVEGSTSWNGNSLVFTPASELTRDSVYTISIDKGVRSVLGKTSADPYKISVKVGEKPKVVLVSPEDITVPVGTPIVIMFSSPIRALGDMSNPHLPITVEPRIDYSIDWIDTSTIKLIPSHLDASTKYTVKIAKGIKSRDGGLTEADTTVSFQTEQPILKKNSHEAEGTQRPYGVTEPIKLTFNQKMNLSSVTGKMKSEPSSSWNASYDKEDPNTVVLTPRDPLTRNSVYTITLPAGTQGVEGNLGMLQDEMFGFRTAGDFVLNSSDPAQNSTGSSIYNISLTLSNPIDIKGLENKIEIIPAPKDKPTVSVSDTTLYINTTLKYSTVYQLSFKNGVVDMFGQPFKTVPKLTFTTQEMTPQVRLGRPNQYSTLNILNAYQSDFSLLLSTINTKRVLVETCQIPMEDIMKDISRFSTEYFPDTCVSKASWTTEPKGDHDTAINAPLDLNRLTKNLLPSTPDIWYIRVTQEGRDKNDYNTIDGGIFVRTKTALTLKRSGKNFLLWATDLKTGQVVSDTPVDIYVNGNQGDVKRLEKTYQTNKDGIVMDTSDKAYDISYAVAKRDNDLSFVSGSMSNGIETWDFGLNSGSNASGLIGHVYTERPVYRGGDTVYIKGFIRKDNGKRLVLPEETDAEINVSNTEGTTIYNKKLKLSSFGSFDTSFTLAENAKLGDYALTTTLKDPKTKETIYFDQGGYSGFLVEEYQKPEFKLSISSDKEDYVGLSKPIITTTAEYYSGGPVKNGKLSYTINKIPYYFAAPGELSSYTFNDNTDYSSDAWATKMIDQGETTLDNQGTASISAKTDAIKDTLASGESALITYEGTITDSQSRSVSDRVSSIIHASRTYVGLKAQSYISSEGEKAMFDIATATSTGERKASTAVSLRVLERKYVTVKKEGIDSNSYNESVAEDKEIYRTNVTTGEKGLASFSHTFASSGIYILEATVRDAEGNLGRSAIEVYVTGRIAISFKQDNTSRVELTSDKKFYKTGETAKILAPSSFKKALILITKERDSVISYQVKSIENSYTFPIILSKNDLPNIYVSTIINKIPDEKDTEPAFEVGYTNLAIDTTEKELTIDITPDKPSYEPRQKVTLDIRTKTTDGRGVSSEVALAVVDESILALVGNPKVDLVNGVFYSTRPLGVMTAANLTSYISTKNVRAGKAKGGGGGLSDKPRGDFRDTAYVNQTVTTDQQGNARISFTLPDNLTTWQVLTKGITKESEVGNKEIAIVTEKKLMVRPALPSFVRPGDALIASYAIINNSKDADRVTVALTGTGFTLQGSATDTIDLASHEEHVVTFPIKINSDGIKPSFTLAATGKQNKDSIVISPKLEKGLLPRVDATFGKSAGVSTEYISRPETANTKESSFTVAVSRTLLPQIEQASKDLITYEYECSEQLMSKVLSYMLTKQILGSALQTKLDTTKALQRIYATQRADGGFGFWDSSQNSYPILSAYIVEGLWDLKGMGVSVDNNVLANSIKYLETELKERDLKRSPKIILLHALAYAQSKSVSVGTLNSLYLERDKLNLYEKALLAESFHFIGKKDEATTLIKEVLNTELIDTITRSLSYSDEHVRYALVTQTGITATVLRALLRINPTHPLRDKLVYGIQTGNRSYHNTQDEITTLRALVSYYNQFEKQLPKELSILITKNSEKIFSTLLTDQRTKDSKTDTFETLLPYPKINEISLSSESKSPFWYDITLSTALNAKDVEAVGRGISINRAWYSLSDTKALTPLTTLKLGETYKGKVTITVPEDRSFVIVDAPYASGMRGINTRLATNKQSDDSSLNQGEEGNMWSWYEKELWRFNQVEYRDDRLVLSADYLPKGVYEYEFLVRAESRGSFLVPSARASLFYFPEIAGNTTAQEVTIK